MPGENGGKRRVLLVVTEASPLDKLWGALVDQIADASADVVAILVGDDSWTRAATLPFTREISRLSGGSQVFTARRAEQIIGSMIDRAQERIRQLAADRQLQVAFKILPAGDPHSIREFVRVEYDVLIGPAVLRRWPVFADLTLPDGRVFLVDEE